MTVNQNSIPGLLAIVGRPNVGKSTLFNRIVGARRAIVGDEPGITRDRLYAEAYWLGRRFRVVDTGGILPEDKEFIPAEIFRQARFALDEAAAIVMVVDGRAAMTAPDMELARLLQRTGKPLFLAVNKVDSPKQDTLVDEFRRLGIRNVLPVSAEHGDGVAELLEEVVKVVPTVANEPESSARRSRRGRSLPSPEWEDEAVAPDLPVAGEEESPAEEVAESRPEEIKVAIIGRPNVGKSTLLNQLTGTSRAIVSPVAGTTRDSIDELVERDGCKYRFVDTAGIRRKGKTKLMAEKLSVVMARKSLEAADIVLMMIDATEGVSALDANIAGYAHESGRSLILVVNKWDLVTHSDARGEGAPADPAIFEQQARSVLKFLNYVPFLFVSASTGRNVEKIFPMIELVASERRKRVTTGEMNRFLRKIDFDRATVPASRKVKVYYMTQTAVAPPTFILFTDKDVKLHFSYERFLENQLRDAFKFIGTPIWIKSRARKRRDFVPGPGKKK
ncbi:MAG: ribosome biogenesis GTPase Der [Candidatus Korobacteraceae bacterium]